MKKLAIILSFCSLAAPAMAANGPRLNCDDLKAKVEAKFQAKGVKNYTLEAADMKADDGGAKVVGTCDGNTKKMLYKRGSAPAAESKADSKPAAAAAPKADAKPAAKTDAPKTDAAKPSGK